MGARNQPALLLFVSLAMPRESLIAYADQAERAQATMVIRGVKDRSMRRTMEAVQQIIGERKVAWVIDPTAFDRFDVTAVPSVVLTAASFAGASCSTRECTAPDSFAKVAGEVPIDHSLAGDPPARAGIASRGRALHQAVRVAMEVKFSQSLRLVAFALASLRASSVLADPASDFNDGKAVGNALSGQVLSGVKSGSASSTSPSQTASPPQSRTTVAPICHRKPERRGVHAAQIPTIRAAPPSIPGSSRVRSW